jgi:fatty acid desaturase
MLNRDIKKKILLNFKSRNNFYATTQTLVPIFLIFTLYVIAANFSFDKTFALIIPIGWIYYRLYFPLHDLSHENLFSSKKINIFFGYLIASIFATPFRSFQKNHMDHHKFAGTEKDPASPDYNFKIENKIFLIKFLIGPLFGSNFVKKLTDYYKDLSYLKLKIFRNSKLQETKNIKFDTIGYIAILLMHFIIFLLVTKLDLNLTWKYFYFVILPGITISLFLSTLRQFLEHHTIKISSSEIEKYTARTFSCSYITSILFTSNSFQYHNEHHEFPSISSYYLPQVHQMYKIDENQKIKLSDSYSKVLMSIWNSV